MTLRECCYFLFLILILVSCQTRSYYKDSEVNVPAQIMLESSPPCGCLYKLQFCSNKIMFSVFAFQISNDRSVLCGSNVILCH